MVKCNLDITCPTPLPWLVPALVPGNIIISEFGGNQPELVSAVFAKSGPPWSFLALKEWITFRTSAGLVHLCSPAQGLYSAPQWDAGFHQSILPPTQEQRKVPLMWNSRISFYPTPQSILFSPRQGECCCFTANALYRKYRYIKPLLWPCLTFTLQINGSW